MILAIDPGCLLSAYVVLDDNLKPIAFEKVNNFALNRVLPQLIEIHNINHIAIEMVASYGMAVGREVFDTVFWIGRYFENCSSCFMKDIKLIYRKEEKMLLCHSMKAKDSNIIQALKDRFGDKGTKKNPGWFYGFSKDVWQAYAVGVTYYDLYVKD